MNPAYDSALRMLARRDHVSGELRRKLKQKKHTEENIEQALEQMQEAGYLDDIRVSERRLQFLEEKGFSRMLAIQKLVSIGFNRKILESSPPNSESIEVLTSLFEKKLRGQNDPKTTARAIRFLMQKGHSLTQIRAVFSKLKSKLQLEWPHS